MTALWKLLKHVRWFACILQVSTVAFPPEWILNNLHHIHATWIFSFLSNTPTYQYANSCVFGPGCIETMQSPLQPSRYDTKHTLSVITLNWPISLFLYLYAQMHLAITSMHKYHTSSSLEPGSHDPCSKLARNINSNLRGILTH